MAERDPELRALVRRVIGRVKGERGRAEHPAGFPAGKRVAGVHVDVRPPSEPDRPGPAARGLAAGRPLLGADALREIPDGGVLRIERGTRVTPLAREEAFRRGIRLSAAGGSAPSSPDACPRAGEPLRVALGADHGGFARKLEVAAWLRELGHRPIDFGTHDENPVDYPDIAEQVARAVAEGRADAGVLIDGAGIGSAMAANKVPGVRAANCHEPRMAANAREHNYANVLTLGARMIGSAASYEVLRTFLATPWGAERHGRRVAKIAAIERKAGRPADAGNPAAS